MCQVGVFPAGVHQATVRDNDRCPVSVLVECQPAYVFCLRIIRDEVCDNIISVYTGNAVITDIAGGYDFAVRQIVGIAEFQVRFIDRYLLVESASICVHFVDLPFPVFVERRKEQSVGIPMQLDIGNRNIGVWFIECLALNFSAQIGKTADFSVISFASVGEERVIVGGRCTE